MIMKCGLNITYTKSIDYFLAYASTTGIFPFKVLSG